MGDPVTGAMMGLSIGQGYQQGQAQRSQARFQQMNMEQNARFAKLAADDALRRGDKDAARVKQEASKVESAQRAALATQGLDVGSGTAFDIQMETAEMGALDALAVKNNAWREAWGFRTQAIDLQGQARMTGMAGQQAYRSSLLTGGLQAAQFGMQSMNKGATGAGGGG